MYNVEFYENANGESELWDFLEELRVKSSTNKDARIQFKQISLYIQLLQDNGTRLPDNITKHLDEDIWELRPGNNRVFTFTTRMILSSFYITFARNHRKHPAEKSNVPKQNVTIIWLERRQTHENLERL